MRRVIFYRTAAGRCPIQEFLDDLKNEQAEDSANLMRVIREEQRISTDILRKVTADVWELRVRSGGQQLRYLGFFDGRTLVILTNGFVKKRQKTPRSEIALANRRRKDYLSRK